jgi:hypothetical protein
MSVKEDWPRKYNGRKYRKRFDYIKWNTIKLTCPLCAFVSGFIEGDGGIKRCQACGSPLCE